MGLSARQKTRLTVSSDGLWVYKGAGSRQNGWATVKTAASRVFALKGHNMSARGKRSGAAAERRPGLPIDEIAIALKGRNRQRALVPGFASVSFIALSWCCSVPCSSTVRDIPWHIARFHVALQPGPISMMSLGHTRPFGLAFVAPFQGFVTRLDSQPRATQPLVELADACPGLTCDGPFRAIEFVCQTRIASSRHGNATPRKSQIKYGGHIRPIGGNTRPFPALVSHLPPHFICLYMPIPDGWSRHTPATSQPNRPPKIAGIAGGMRRAPKRGC